jgi:FkbM family methyltransferase
MRKIVQSPEGWNYLQGDPHMSQWLVEAHDISHDSNVDNRLCSFIEPGTVVIDAGAHVGTHSIAYMRALREGSLYCFEPMPDIYQCLLLNIEKERSRGNKVTVFSHNVALGDGTEKGVTLRQFTANGGLNYGMTRVVSSHGSVPCVRLDDVIPWQTQRVSYMKIDVEGSEPWVLRGARQLIEKHRPMLYVEIHHVALRQRNSSAKELTDLLYSLGYRLEIDGQIPQTDAFCYPI